MLPAMDVEKGPPIFLSLPLSECGLSQLDTCVGALGIGGICMLGQPAEMATWSAQSCFLSRGALQLLLLAQLLSELLTASCHSAGLPTLRTSPPTSPPMFGELPTLGSLPEAPCSGCTNQKPGPVLEERATLLRGKATRQSLQP